MVPTIVEAGEYIQLNVIDIEDWVECDESRKTRILNVAKRTIDDAYLPLIIPHEAYYEFCPLLASYFNDTNRLNSQGIASFSITGVGSFTFNQAKSLSELIPDSVKSLIEKENGVSLRHTVRLKYRV